MNLIYFDLAFLVICCILVAIFLYKNKKRVKVESKIFLLYRSKFGIKFIDWFSKKFSRALHVISYFSITFGFLAMFAAFYLFAKSTELMATMAVVPNIPPLMPLVPYTPQIFNLPLPPFYFVYWLIIILIVAVTHEFSHGIFARLYKLKIKATGFGFLGPFLAAFVEPDEKQLQKSKPKKQLAILSSGTFSNFIFAIIFLLVIQLFFFACYDKMGVAGYGFAQKQINLSSVEQINNYSLSGFLNLSDDKIKNITDMVEIKADNETYYIGPMDLTLFNELKQVVKKDVKTIIVYEDSPALRANLSGAIVYLGEYKIDSPEDLHNAIITYKPNDTITIQTTEKNVSVTLDKNPLNESRPYLGIGFPQISGFSSYISKISSPFFSPFSYASPKFNPEVLTFIRDLLFWLIIICFSVAIINMLPIGILDGGRFLYVTALWVTKSEKAAEIIFKIASFLVILLLVAMMVIWFMRVF